MVAFISLNAYRPLDFFFWALAVAALIVEVWAFVDAARRPTAAFPAAGKQTKPIWLIITGVAGAIGLYTATEASALFIIVGILPVIAFIAAAYYLADVRPKVREIGRGSGGSSHMGPYGPW